MNALAEQRRHFRKRGFRPAHIVLSEKAPKLECAALDLSVQGVRLRVSTTYGIPHGSMSLLMASGRPVVPFGEPVQKSA